MILDDTLFDEVLLVKVPLSWTGKFLVGDDSDRESFGSAVDEAVGLMLAEVGELVDKGLPSRGFVFLDVESRLRQLAAGADHRLGVDVDVFVGAAKSAMARIAPAMGVLLGEADLTMWLNVYARIAAHVPRSRRAHLVWRDTADECSVGWWDVRIGANGMLNRLARLVGMYRGTSETEVAMAIVSTFEDLVAAMGAGVDTMRVAEVVRVADSLVRSVQRRTAKSGLSGYQGAVGREASVESLPWLARFEVAISALRSIPCKAGASA